MQLPASHPPKRLSKRSNWPLFLVGLYQILSFWELLCIPSQMMIKRRLRITTGFNNVASMMSHSWNSKLGLNSILMTTESILNTMDQSQKWSFLSLLIMKHHNEQTQIRSWYVTLYKPTMRLFKDCKLLIANLDYQTDWCLQAPSQSSSWILIMLTTTEQYKTKKTRG